MDSTARLWETSTGKEFRQFVGHTGSVTSVAFSPDGNFVLTGSEDKTVRLWKTGTGKEVRHFKGHTVDVASVAFSPNGHYILTGSSDCTAVLWEAATGKKIRRFMGHISVITSVAFSPDGRYVLTGSTDRTARLWETATGRTIHRFKGHSDGVNSIVFSPNGRLILTGSADMTARLWETATGKEIRRFKNDSRIKSVAFSPDGKYVLTGNQFTTQLWNVATGKKIREITKIGFTNFVTSVAFSPDGKYVLAASDKVRLVETATGKEVRRMEGRTNEMFCAAFSPDAKYMLTDGEDNSVLLWSTTTGQKVKRFEGHTDQVTSFVFSPDGKYILTGSRDKTARLWDVATGFQLRQFLGHSDVISGVAFSPDGKYALTANSGDNLFERGTIKLWEITTGTEVRHFEADQLGMVSVAFSPDGRHVATATSTRPQMWDTATGKEETHFEEVDTHNELFNASVTFSPDGKYTLMQNGRVWLWETDTGKRIKRLPAFTDEFADVFVAAIFTPDGSHVLMGNVDGTVRIYETATGKEVSRFEEGVDDASSGMVSPAFSPDGRFVVTSNYDGSFNMTQLWGVATGKELCRLYTFDDGNWAWVDPEGRFDTSDLEQIKGLSWIMPDDPMKPLPVEIFMRQYYEPRLLARILAGEKFKPVPPIGGLNRVQPPVKILDIKPEAGSPDTVAVTVQVGKAKGNYTHDGKTVTLETDVYDLRLFRDGQLVGYNPENNGIAMPLDPKIGTATITFPHIKLPHTDGVKGIEFSAYAFNVDRIKSDTDRKTYTLPQALAPVKGRAYVVTVGVNAYEDTRWNLAFAANDAHKTQEALGARLSQSGQYSEVVGISLVSDHDVGGSLTENRAMKQNFKAVLDALAGKKPDAALLGQIPGAAKLRQARPEDVVIISWSGHGYADGNGNFYLLPHDIGPDVRRMTPEVLQKTVSSDELSLWLRDVDAGAMAMIIDACQSAASVETSEFKPGPMGSRGLGQLAYDKGMLILAASQADNVALESNLIKQGLLSYALVANGLEAGQADWKPKDGQITLNEWLSYGVERVPSLYEEVKAGSVQSFGKGVVAVNGDKKQVSTFQQPSLFDFNKKKRDALLTLLTKP